MRISKPQINDKVILDDSLDEVRFSFKYLQDKSITPKTESKFYYDFLFRLKRLSELGWLGINHSDKHSYGVELIPINQIKYTENISVLTRDISKLTVFRATGDNHAFMGVRDRKCFYVIFIEAKFGDIYSHGK